MLQNLSREDYDDDYDLRGDIINGLREERILIFKWIDPDLMQRVYDVTYEFMQRDDRDSFQRDCGRAGKLGYGRSTSNNRNHYRVREDFIYSERFRDETGTISELVDVYGQVHSQLNDLARQIREAQTEMTQNDFKHKLRSKRELVAIHYTKGSKFAPHFDEGCGLVSANKPGLQVKYGKGWKNVPQQDGSFVYIPGTDISHVVQINGLEHRVVAHPSHRRGKRRVSVSFDF